MIENRIKKLQWFQSSPAIITTANTIAVNVLVLNICQLKAIYLNEFTGALILRKCTNNATSAGINNIPHQLLLFCCMVSSIDLPCLTDKYISVMARPLLMKCANMLNQSFPEY